MEVLYLLSLDKTFALVMWAALVQIGVFYMQRWHYESVTEWGVDARGPKFLGIAARVMGWPAFLMAGYILFRVGLIPATVGLIVIFAAPIAVSTLDVWLVGTRARPMAALATPLTVLAFIMMLRAAVAL